MLKCLDLFCGVGGASYGLSQVGYEVTGVDIIPQPNYPYEFIQGNALDIDLNGYDLVWASPPCQAYTWASKCRRNTGTIYPDLVDIIRNRFKNIECKYVIENTPGAPLIDPIVLCGAMFQLPIIRHRLFEANFHIEQPIHIPHHAKTVIVAGHHGGLWQWSKAMDINWATDRYELAQAVPPAYSKYVGEQSIK